MNVGSRYINRITRGAFITVALALLAACGSNDDEATTGAVEQDEPATSSETPETPETPETSEVTTAERSSQVEVATQFWEALAAGDRDATLALVDPDADSSGLSPFGRANTLEGQFDWYEAVGWQWTLDGCDQVDDGTIECVASARNSWSEALGVDPVTGTFVVDVTEAGVTAVTDRSDQFISQWGPMVFRVFAEWVDRNHPADAATMFNFEVDIDDNILDLYEINTTRFVEAQSES